MTKKLFRALAAVSMLAFVATVVVLVGQNNSLAATGIASSAESATLADPTLLRVATVSQIPLTAAYDGLKVPSLAAGNWYLDPTTNAKIYKLTSGTFPVSSPNWGHDYSEGGDEVSLPYNGSTRAVLVRQNGGSWWLVDFTPGVGVGNPRRLTGNLAPLMDLAFTFSNNPATPYYAYVSNGSTIRRFDIRTMTETPGNGWPVTGESSAMWLHQSESDGFFVWMRGANGSTIVGYEPSTATLKTFTNPNLNEPRIDRAGRYVGVSMNSPRNGLVVWDWQTNSVPWSTTGDPGIPFAHNASLRRRWLTVDWNMSYPPDYGMFIPNAPGSGQHIGGPANGTLVYGNGNWIQHPADLNDQWALFSHYGSLRPSETYWLAPGGMVLITPNGQRRLLGHPYNTTGNYTFFSFPKFSPDGKYVMFTSNMDGSGRSDVFLAELPQTASNPDTTPPTVSITAPAVGVTVSGSVTVSATADDVGVVAGVQFKLDGSNLGPEDASAPFAVSWTTASSSNGSHTLTAVARDRAGNSMVSTAVGVIVNNSDTIAPLISSVAAASVSSSGATISWVTNEPADSRVDYGPSTAYGSSTTLNGSLVRFHSQALSGLTAGVLYHYRVRSRDAAGNLAVSGDFTFTTLPVLNMGAAAAVADPVNCTGYPEPRIQVENQSWWEPQPGPAGHPGTGHVGHIHVGACFPMYQTLTGPTLHLDITVKLHNMPGTPEWLRAQSYGDVGWQKRLPSDKSPASYIPRCAAADCEYTLPWDIDLTKIRFNGWHQFGIFLNIGQTNGAVQRNWTRWYVNFQRPGLPQGVPGADGQFGTRGSIYSAWVGADSWGNGINSGGKYAQAQIGRTSIPWNERTGTLTPLSGTWTPTVRFQQSQNFVYVDPAFHATPPSKGKIVFEGTASNAADRIRTLSIDTTRFANGLHRLVIGTGNVTASGANTGLLVIPFLVANPGNP